jgi:hypothetical protein
MSEVLEQPPSLRQLQNKRKAGTATPEELETLRSYERESKQRSRDAERAQTDVGRKMASSRIVVDKDEADAILKERGLRDVHGKSAHIRKVIYRLAGQAAEHLGLPGPNWFLLRFGFCATEAAMNDSHYVPTTPESAEENPDESSEGELSTNRELAAMFEMNFWYWLQEACKDAEAAATTILTRHPVDDWAAWAIFMCEVLPDVPAKTSTQQVNTARLFGRSLQQDDVREGETCRQYVSRIFDAWKSIGFSPLHPLLFEFDRGFNEPTAFDIAEWIWPFDADAVIEIDKLPALP